MINIRQALAQAIEQLSPDKTDSRLEAEILLSHVLNKNRAYLYAHLDDDINPAGVSLFQKLVEQRADGLPIAYLTGQREFWSMNLTVNAHTLIPRHETERLVELTLELLPNISNLQLLDLGTGSGAIALALAKERPNWHIDACDQCMEALDIAAENANTHNINNVHFYRSDWFKNLPNKQYHAIVSNPPYIAADDPHIKQGDLRFEPQSALISGINGLADLQYIIEHSYEHLLPGGLLLLEHGFEQKLNVCAILNLMGYINIHTWQDIHGHDRVSGGWHP